MSEIENVIWVAHSLFQRGLVTGSTGNISFRDKDIIYVSKSGSCFGRLDENSFAKISISGEILEGKPSKEWPMHLKLYQMKDDCGAVVHTHSLNSTLISCVKGIEDKTDLLFEYTPYLMMQTNGKIGVVNYEKPGSKELFEAFYKISALDVNTYILKNHGIFVSGTDVLKAFYILEEFEQSSKIVLSVQKDLEFEKIR